VHAPRSVLEVKTRRLLVASGFRDFVREFALDWRGSVPGRHGYRIVLATWDKVTAAPEQLLRELEATLAA
jgi:hypothetical protein